MASVNAGHRETHVENTGNDAEFMLLPEVAALTRQTPSTLRWLRHKGEGPPAVKLGRRLVYRRSAVLEWIRQEEKKQSGAR